MNIKELLDKTDELARMKRDIEVEIRVQDEALLKEVLNAGYIHCITVNKTRLRRTVYGVSN